MATPGIQQQKITFVGAGSMAEAIIRGLITKGGVNGENVCVMNRSNRIQLERLQADYGICYAAEPEEKQEAVRSASVIVLAFKPKDAAEGILGIRELVRPGQLIVSVIAGLSIEVMEGLLGQNGLSIVRTMPNTSSTIGLGATGIAFSPSVSPEGRELALEMFSSTGIVTIVEEQQIDAITAVSGSGPAYIYLMMEAMVEGGIRCGLSPEDAHRMTVQTVLGAAHMVQTTGEEAAELRRKVTSPNGTTEAAIEVMSRLGFQEAIIQGMQRCAERAGEMGSAIAASVTTSKK